MQPLHRPFLLPRCFPCWSPLIMGLPMLVPMPEVLRCGSKAGLSVIKQYEVRGLALGLPLLPSLQVLVPVPYVLFLLIVWREPNAAHYRPISLNGGCKSSTGQTRCFECTSLGREASAIRSIHPSLLVNLTIAVRIRIVKQAKHSKSYVRSLLSALER